MPAGSAPDPEPRGAAHRRAGALELRRPCGPCARGAEASAGCAACGRPRSVRPPGEGARSGSVSRRGQRRAGARRVGVLAGMSDERPLSEGWVARRQHPVGLAELRRARRCRALVVAAAGALALAPGARIGDLRKRGGRSGRDCEGNEAPPSLPPGAGSVVLQSVSPSAGDVPTLP